MKIAFVSLPVAGHLNPMSALAAEVQSRGHEVIFLSVLDAQKQVEGAGLHFFPVATEAFPPGATQARAQQLSEAQGEEAMTLTLSILAVITKAFLGDVERILRDEQVDGAIFDTAQPYLELSAMSLNIPYIQVSNAVHIDVSGDSPIRFYDWEPSDSAEARERNLDGIAFYRKMLQPSVEVAMEYAQKHGLEIDWDDLTATRSRLAAITQVPAVFDFQPDLPAEHFIHAGPFVNTALRPSAEFPWSALSDAPLVYVSMGTLQNGIERVFRTIFDAIAPLTQFQFVVSIGNRLKPSTFEPVPEHVLMVPHAPQLELLKRAALCVTHAGLNTVLESLANGVPLAAMPVTNDQPGVAARIRAHAVGDFLPLPEVTPDSLRNLILKVFNDPQYRKNARKMAKAIKETGGLSLAAAIIEEKFSAETVGAR